MVGTASGSVQTLFDFTRLDELSGWTEHSDTVKPSGASKAALVLQKSQLFQRAVFFSLFAPRINGTGFAGIRADTSFDLREHQYIAIKCRGQGANFKYKMLLRHKGLGRDSVIYGQIFTVSENEFSTVKLPLGDFKPYHRGLPLAADVHPLDLSAITSMGIKVDNGPYLPDNQPGVSSLEIDWIKAVK
ncbi:uncharacterized protein LOC111642847 [Copidosoma floridanum]|uniref:uncharacterized protein LOC106636955 n=1 Tax=Copidosoma floridanum TaxID=29053 RepID=UPI0006C9A011|nr:uncharacterized protein LOC106636955 [Copidosoma floridanum]XP_023245146.1 uncharacterized protein LOC111642847 [Copidosoma floridanum]